MATVRFTPQAQGPRFFGGSIQQSSGRGQGAIGKALENIGDELIAKRDAELKRKQLLEQKEAEAMSKATANTTANTLATSLSASLDDMKTTYQKNGLESNFRNDALETIESAKANAFQQYVSNQYADTALFETAVEERLQPLRAAVIKQHRELVVGKSMRELNNSVDQFVRLSDSSFRDIDYHFQRLQNRADQMEADLVIDRKGKVEVLEGAMVDMLKRRQRYLIENDPDHAEEQFKAEARYFNSYLSPLYSEKLREAKEKGDADGKAEMQRQLINQVTLGDLPLDAALGEADRLGLDASKIEETWANHNNRRYQYLEHLRTSDERVFKTKSDELRTNLTLRASKEKGFDLRSAVEKNLRELTGEDARALLTVAEANEKALSAPGSSEPEALRTLKRIVADAPHAASTERAIFEAVKAGRISKPDYEQLLDKLYENRKQLKTDAKQRQHSIYTEGQKDLDETLKTTSTLDFDPVANKVRDRFSSRLRAAMFGPEMMKGDADAFATDPLGFIARLKSEGRTALESSVAQEALNTLKTFPQLIIPETATINLEAIRAARKEGLLTNVEAERIFFLDQLVKQGAIQLPFKPVPAPPPQPKQEEPGWLEQLKNYFSGEPNSSGESAPKKSERPATRKKNF